MSAPVTMQPPPRTAAAPLPAPELGVPGRLHGFTRADREGRVDSVQWVVLPPGHPARELPLDELERRYFTWVPRLTAGLVRPHPRADGGLTLGIEPLGWPEVMRLSPPVVEGGLRLRHIEGGLLAHPGGTFSVARIGHQGEGLEVAVRAFRHRLPAPLYWGLQVPLHERTSDGFLRQLEA